MTDWDLITECIRNAMRTVEKAGQEDSNEKLSRKELRQIHQQMQELIERLTRLQTVLEHQTNFAADELTDMLSKSFTGKQSEYRRTPRMNTRR